jgi:type III secretion protein U
VSQGSSSSGEKTEQPTPKKLRDSRKKGQVARSQEVVSASSLFAVICYLWLNWGGITNHLVEMIDQISEVAASSGSMSDFGAIRLAGRTTVIILLPVLAVVFVAGFFANYVQFGSLFAIENIKPKLENISPAKGLKRIFSKKQLVETLKSIVKIAFLSTLLLIVMRSSIGPAINAVSCGFPCVVEITVDMLEWMILYSALAFILIALLDFVFQRHSHTKSLMMTKEEVKREFKESEGDPIVKGQRRQIAQELVMNESGTSARRASAVVVNPTKLAIAIEYQAEKTKLPKVTAKGRNLHALFIRTEAEKAGVPIFLNIPLARSLYSDVEVDGFIPDELFKPVAEILVWIQHNRHLLYNGPLDTGVIDMERGDHRPKQESGAPAPGPFVKPAG